MEDQSHKESNISPGILKAPNEALTTGAYGFFSHIRNPSDVDIWWSIDPNYTDSSDRKKFLWLSRAIRSLHTDMPTQSSVWLNTSPILLHEDSDWLYIVKTDPQKDDDIISCFYTYHETPQDSVINVDFSGWSESKQQLQEIRSVNNHILLKEMLSEIDDILKNEYDWDEIDYIKPTPEDINYAKSVLTDFVFTISYEGYSLKKPYISNFEEGGASIKWKIGDRTLYLEIGQNDSVVSKVWRKSGKTLAKERPLLKKDYLRLWKWIINEE